MTAPEPMLTRVLRSPCAVLLWIGTASVAHAGGATITVTTLEDRVDFAGAQQVADLPGPDGRVSFREAVLAVNATPGPQTIAFAIPTSEFWLMTNVALLKVETGAFSLTDDATTIDFSTQTTNVGDTNPSGPEVGFYGLEPNGWGAGVMYVNGDDCVFRGLGIVQQRGYAFVLRGNGNRVVGCQISGPLHAAVYVNGSFNGAPASGNVIGGTAPGEGNVLSSGAGVRIDGPATQNVVIGNTLTGTSFGVEVRTPTCCPGNDAVGNRIGGPTPAERNVIAGGGRYGEEGFPTGGQVAVQYSTGTIVEGNHVGVLADGFTVPAVQRGPVGVEVRSSPGTVVRDNVIAGIRVVGVNHYAGQVFGVGIDLMGDCAGTVVEGNRIGVGADGETPTSPLNRAGVLASYWSVNGMPVVPGPVRIGGMNAGQGNRIAQNELYGVRVESQVRQVRISGNSIDENGGLGIDLVPGAGVTPNDPGDGDDGGNGLQNVPVVQSATVEGGGVRVAGTISTSPSSALTLELFASPACDPSGSGEGRQLLGRTSVVTDAAGDAAFDVVLPGVAAPGSAVTATATLEPSGATSELSACAPLGGGASVVAFCFGDGTGIDCPCGNAGAPGNGCESSAATGGARLGHAGTASVGNDTFVLQGSGMPPTSTALYFQGDAQVHGGLGDPFGDGLRCVGGTVIRLGLETSSGGASAHGGPAGDTPVSVRGMVPAGGGTRHYQVWYRNAASFCTPSTFNLSNGLQVAWSS